MGLTKRSLFGFSLFPLIGPAYADPAGTNSLNFSGTPAGGSLSGTYPNPGISFITGNTTGTAAASGVVGEYTMASIATSSAVALVTTGTVTSLVTLPLAPGDWDVWGAGIFQSTSSAVGWKAMTIAVSNSSNSIPTAPAPGVLQLALSSTGATSLTTAILVVTPQQFISSAAMTAYLVAACLATGGVASCTAAGIIQARRMR